MVFILGAVDNPPDFIHKYFRQFWLILKMDLDHPSLTGKRPMSEIYRNYIVANSSIKRVIAKTAITKLKKAAYQKHVSVFTGMVYLDLFFLIAI